MSEIEKCPICLEGGNMIKTRCMHSFHKECIKDWEEETNSCPICRDKLNINKPIRKLSCDTDDDFNIALRMENQTYGRNLIFHIPNIILEQRGNGIFPVMAERKDLLSSNERIHPNWNRARDIVNSHLLRENIVELKNNIRQYRDIVELKNLVNDLKLYINSIEFKDENPRIINNITGQCSLCKTYFYNDAPMFTCLENGLRYCNNICHQKDRLR